MDKRLTAIEPALPPGCGRDPLVSAIMTFVARTHAPNLDRIRTLLEREIDAAGPGALALLARHAAVAGTDWAYYARDPLARRIHHVLADRLLRTETSLLGGEHLDALGGRPAVIVANHLSYSDANLLEVLFTRAGATDVSDRLTVVAGPKVYANPRWRFSSLCFGTIKTPQSSARSSDEAVMNARDVARAARRSIEIAHERLRRGDALVVFAEGTRSRSASLQPLLPGVARYFDVPGTVVLPVGIVGTERLFPIGEDALRPVPLTVRIGTPLEASDLHAACGEDRRLLMDVVGLAIAGVLPESYRGAYGAAADLAEARRRLAALQAR
jgi:1-acyl-sn-glycerol-3-phosphate acyltransferase